MRNEGAMLGSDFNVMRGMAVKNITEGIRDAGSNAGGAMNAFMGVGMGMNAMNGTLGSLNGLMTPNDMANQQPVNQVQQTQTQAAGWMCDCGQTNSGKFCSNCGKPAPAPKKVWKCACGQENSGKFCGNCGKPAPAGPWTCTCGAVNEGKFCSNCGKARG